MCGIAGIVHFDGAPVDGGVLRAMTRSIAHRGPDGEGIWTEGSVGFGHRRLAIRGLGHAGYQPMHHPKGGLTVTYNGEIYNDQPLRREIGKASGIELDGKCDTDILTPGYGLWGADFIKRMRGMFAFGLWDAERSELVLVRDPAGVKPLFYSHRGNSVYFASEIKALHHVPDVPVTYSAYGLHCLVAQGYPGPDRTTFADIHPVPPGTILRFNRDGMTAQRYWQPSRTNDIADMGEALELFDATWRSVVEDMVVSDVPVGLLLSGGIDSALTAQVLGAVDQYPAFTARFKEDSFDESAAAADIAARTGLDHHTSLVDVEADLENVFRSLVHHHDGQLGDSSALPFYLICQAARASVPVLFTGDGADELFAGYETYRATRIAHAVAPFVPRPLAMLGARAASRHVDGNGGVVSTAEKVMRFLDGLASYTNEIHPQWRRYLPARMMGDLYGPGLSDLLDDDPLREYGDAMGMSGSKNLLDRCLTGDQNYYLPGDMIVKSDSMSMAHGVEVRVPFLDQRVMDMAGSLHRGLLTSLRGPDKNLLRQAAGKAGLGLDVTSRKKHGFNLPVARILRHGLADLGRWLLDREADILEPHFSADGVRQMWRQHSDSTANHGYLIWTLLSLAVSKQKLTA